MFEWLRIRTKVMLAVPAIAAGLAVSAVLGATTGHSHPRPALAAPSAISEAGVWSGAAPVLLVVCAVVLVAASALAQGRGRRTVRRGGRDDRDALEASSSELVRVGTGIKDLTSRQLALITELEHEASDPDALAHLFALDHLATRARGEAESLLALAGVDPPHRWSHPVPVANVVRAALAEVEDYERVSFGQLDEARVGSEAVSDLIHLVAALLERALALSPVDHEVEVRGRRDDQDYVLAVADGDDGRDDDQDPTPLPALAARLARRLGASVGCLPHDEERGGVSELRLPAHLLASSYPPERSASSPDADGKLDEGDPSRPTILAERAATRAATLAGMARPDDHLVVRPFVLTLGRTRASRHDLGSETIVVVTPRGTSAALRFELGRILTLCRDPRSIADVAAELRLPPVVTTVLVGDLITDGLLAVHQPDPLDVELTALLQLIERARQG